MPRIATLAALACALAGTAILVTPAQSKQDPRTQWFESYEIAYLDTYERGHEAGLDVGRNIVDDGLANGNPAPESQVRESTARIEGWLNPPEPAPVETTEVATTTYSAPAPTSSGGCPASMAPESGSAGYSAYNPSSGATGCYQIIPSTAAAFGCDLGTPAGQDECAARICAGQGSSAWAASGANPC